MIHPTSATVVWRFACQAQSTQTHSRRTFHHALVLRTAVYVSNLPPTISVKSLEQIYSTYGKIKDISLRCSLLNGNQATVEMVNWGAAHKAIHETNGAVIDGREVKVLGLYTDPPADSPIAELASGAIVDVVAKPSDPEKVISPPTVKLRNTAYFEKPKVDSRGHYDPKSYVTHEDDVHEPYSLRARFNECGDSTKANGNEAYNTPYRTPTYPSQKAENSAYAVSTEAESILYPTTPSTEHPKNEPSPTPPLYPIPSLTKTNAQGGASSLPSSPPLADSNDLPCGASLKESTLNPPGSVSRSDPNLEENSAIFPSYPSLFPSQQPTFGADLAQLSPLGYPLPSWRNNPKANHIHTTLLHAKPHTQTCSATSTIKLEGGNPTRPSSSSSSPSKSAISPPVYRHGRESVTRSSIDDLAWLLEK